MEMLWEAACSVIRKAIQNSQLSAAQISGVSFSSHGKGLYLLNSQGKPVRNGIVSSDSRAQSIVDKWHQDGTADKAYPLSLQQLWASHPVALLHWLKQHEPDNYRDTQHVLMVHDYIRYRLTDQIACEETNISGSQLFNQIQSSYDPKLCQLFGIDEANDKLAPVINSAQLAGTVTHKAAAESGLVEGTLYLVVSLMSWEPRWRQGEPKDKLSAVAGTWTISTRVFDEIVPSDYPYVWSKYCIPGTYFVHEGSPTSASNLAWFTRHFFNQRLQDYDVLNHCVAEGNAAKRYSIFPLALWL